MALSPLGILIAAGVSGFSSDYELIETVILGSNQASVTFSNLGDYSATYKHLQLRLAAKGNRATFAQDVLRLTLNGDSASINGHQLVGNGSSVSSSYDPSFNTLAFVDGSGSPADAFGGAVIDFLDAYSSTKNKTVRSFSGHSSPTAGGASGARVGLASLLWRNTNSITSIRLDS